MPFVLLLACAGGEHGPTPDGAPPDMRVDATPPDAASGCVPRPELCNAVDDDCDGQIDEGFALGDACAVGEGACAASGTMICVTPDSTGCSAMAGASSPERCDGVDNDCDGQTDEAEGGAPLVEGCYPGPAGTRGVGRCVAGQMTCVAGEWGPCVDAITPAVETCDTTDEDCDGRADEGVSGEVLRRACFSGPDGAADVGACSGGTQFCIDGAFGACVGEVLPALELCDGVDDDCDGRVDEAVVEGPPCVVGVGACRREGRVGCIDGVQGCDVEPAPPSPEICDGVDNDCDGVIDPEPVCQIFGSCRAAHAAGERRDGVYRLRPGPDFSEYTVYCDQQTDGGGWALVASSRGVPPNDLADRWHADLRRLDPQDPHAGIWAGLRHLDVRFDVRLACRRPDADGFAVDLVHYATDWYPRWTAGTDAESCVSLPDGVGVDVVPPARRDVPSGRWLRRGSPWGAGLVAEPVCDSPDLLLDFEGGGIANLNPADPTSWGQSEGAARCGGPVVGGEWFVFVREGSRWRRDAPFRVGDGPAWEAAPALSCRAACREIAGVEGPLAGFACGISADYLDRQAYLDGWGDAQYCEAPTPDSFVLPSNGLPYDCGSPRCGYSAWVDDHGCDAQNHCWRAVAPPAFVPPAVGSAGTVGGAWRVCAASPDAVELAGGGPMDPVAACAAAGYGAPVAFGAECDADCAPCALVDVPPPEQIEGGRWRCVR